MLDSVAPVSADDADTLRTAASSAHDPTATIVDAITEYIQRGTTSKTKIIDAVANRTGESRRQVESVLNRCTGNDPTIHNWIFTRGARGVQTFELLPPANDEDPVELLEI